jgi:small ubiquitin-related modifier
MADQNEDEAQNNGNDQQADTITLRVKEQTGDEMFFKVKKATKMEKIFSAYAQRRGIQATALRFMIDGERIDKDATPKMLELEDNDQIDVLLEQVGGFYDFFCQI